MNDQTEHTAAYYEETWRNRPVKFTVAELDARARLRSDWERNYSPFDLRVLRAGGHGP